MAWIILSKILFSSFLIIKSLSFILLYSGNWKFYIFGNMLSFLFVSRYLRASIMKIYQVVHKLHPSFVVSLVKVYISSLSLSDFKMQLIKVDKSQMTDNSFICWFSICSLIFEEVCWTIYLNTQYVWCWNTTFFFSLHLIH